MIERAKKRKPEREGGEGAATTQPRPPKRSSFPLSAPKTVIVPVPTRSPPIPLHPSPPQSAATAAPARRDVRSLFSVGAAAAPPVPPPVRPSPKTPTVLTVPPTSKWAQFVPPPEPEDDDEW